MPVTTMGTTAATTMAPPVPTQMEAEASRCLPTLYRQEVSPTALQTHKLDKLRQLRK
jgi:hypothetical protein